MNPNSFTIPFSGHLLRGDTMGPPGPCSLLIIHGAGKGQRAGFYRLREHLAQHGISSLAFDMIGHGETGGEFIESSLARRTEQVLAVISQFPLAQAPTILGSSMGAYNAVKLSEIVPAGALILAAPAAYDTAAYNVPFGDEFSAIIRQPRSWERSDAWEIMTRFEGRVLVLAAQNDTVIPPEIPARLLASASRAASRELYEIPESPHTWRDHLDKDPEQFAVVMKKIREVVEG